MFNLKAANYQVIGTSQGDTTYITAVVRGHSIEAVKENMHPKHKKIHVSSSI